MPAGTVPRRARRGAPLLIAFLLSACGGEEQAAQEKSAEQLAREIEAVAELKPEPKPGELPINLVPLKRSDLYDLGPGPIACYLFRGDRIYFAANGPHGLLRIDGRLTPVAAGGPVGPTGGFFRAGNVRVSIGRRGSYAQGAANYVPGWLAEIAVRAHREAMAQYAVASWTCRGR